MTPKPLAIGQTYEWFFFMSGPKCALPLVHSVLPKNDLKHIVHSDQAVSSEVGIFF